MKEEYHLMKIACKECMSSPGKFHLGMTADDVDKALLETNFVERRTQDMNRELLVLTNQMIAALKNKINHWEIIKEAQVINKNLFKEHLDEVFVCLSVCLCRSACLSACPSRSLILFSKLTLMFCYATVAWASACHVGGKLVLFYITMMWRFVYLRRPHDVLFVLYDACRSCVLNVIRTRTVFLTMTR